MPEQNNNEHNAQVMHMLGQLTGEVRTMHTGMTARMQDIKDEIKRLEEAIPRESLKSISNAPHMRQQLDAKKRSMSALIAEAAKLEATL